MKKMIFILTLLIISIINVFCNELKIDENTNNDTISFKIKPSIFISGSSIEFFDNNNVSFGNMVYNSGFWIGTGSYNNNIKKPISEILDELEVQKLCRKFYSLINFTSGTITAFLLSLLIIPGVIMVLNSPNYAYGSFENLILFSGGIGLIAGGGAASILTIVYGIMLIVFGIQYSKTKKSILKKINKSEISIKTDKVKIKFDLLLSFNNK